MTKYVFIYPSGEDPPPATTGTAGTPTANTPGSPSTSSPPAVNAVTGDGRSPPALNADTGDEHLLDEFEVISPATGGDSAEDGNSVNGRKIKKDLQERTDHRPAKDGETNKDLAGKAGDLSAKDNKTEENLAGRTGDPANKENGKEKKSKKDKKEEKSAKEKKEKKRDKKDSEIANSKISSKRPLAITNGEESQPPAADDTAEEDKFNTAEEDKFEGLEVFDNSIVLNLHLKLTIAIPY